MASGSIEEDLVSLKNYSSKLHESFIKMFRHQELTDAELVCEGRHVGVHKFLLSSSSPIFNNLFKMSNNNKIPIENVKYDDLMNVLEYVYSGNIKIPSTKLSSFMDVAKKFSITIEGAQYNDIVPREQNRFHLGHDNCNTEIGDRKSKQIGINKRTSVDEANHRSRESTIQKDGLFLVSQETFFERMFKARGLPWPFVGHSNQNGNQTAHKLPEPNISAKVKQAQSNSAMSTPMQNVIEPPLRKVIKSSPELDQMSRIKVALAQTEKIRDLNLQIFTRKNEISENELDVLKSKLKELERNRIKIGKKEMNQFKAEQLKTGATQSKSAETSGRPSQIVEKPIHGQQSSSKIDQPTLMSRVALARSQTEKIRDLNRRISTRKHIMPKNELDALKMELNELVWNRIKIGKEEMKQFKASQSKSVETSRQSPQIVEKPIHVQQSSSKLSQPTSMSNVALALAQTEKIRDLNLQISTRKNEISANELNTLKYKLKELERNRIKIGKQEMKEFKAEQLKTEAAQSKSVETPLNEASTSRQKSKIDASKEEIKYLILDFSQISTNSREKRRVLNMIWDLSVKNTKVLDGRERKTENLPRNLTIQEINKIMVTLKSKLDSISKEIAKKHKEKNVDEVSGLQNKFIEVLMHRMEVQKQQEKWQNLANTSKNK
ncbi:DNA repair protein RAD50-like [Contarinia nasturtii]|uniref:DNA repair protein RAD50-like n=1 Tax=Contarinia nasturtii TaxID=265458 RepID=UPI0012D45C61|nr:DNA repair protein RAD50-like [Contarinia nasturtii]